jgi:predicted AlkP superfamily phosphohydrolase/phosphomutase
MYAVEMVDVTPRTRRPVILVGLDACDKDLVTKWSAEGRLPTLARLRETGAWGITESPPGLFVGAVWPSFWTSLNPARHARYCWEQLVPGSYDDVRIHPTDTKGPPFWKAIGDAGRRVAVVDVPKTYPTVGLNGIHVVDWGTHDPDHPHTVSWPESVATDIRERFGDDTIGNCNRFQESPQRLAELRDLIVERIGRKAELLIDCMSREPWDVFVAAFGDTHCVGHQCWHVHDPTHTRHAEVAAQIAGDPMLDVYVAIDAALAKILEAAGDADVLVMCSHGFRSHYDANFMLDEMLARIERPRAVQRDRTLSVAKRAWMMIPAPLRRRLRPVRTRARVELGAAPRATRRFFAIPNNDACGAVRINLIGREPSGRVRPDEFDAVCAALAGDLRAFVNVDTGAPLVRDVKMVRDLYSGENFQHLPDMLVFWNHDTPIERIRSEKTGTIEDRYLKGRTGDHTPLGMFFATGPGVVPGRLDETVSVMDFGPTIAERAGVVLPDIDGRSFAGRVFR